MTKDVAEMKEAIIKTLDELSAEKVAEIWDFTALLRARADQGNILERRSPIALRLVPVDSLLALTGIVSLGGDALADTEAIYDEDFGSRFVG